MHAALAADARSLRTAEGGAQVAQEPTVDPAQADFDLHGEPVGAANVASVDRGRQAVRRVVGHAHGILFLVERLDVAAGAEDLLAHHRGALGWAGPDGGLYPAAVL